MSKYATRELKHDVAVQTVDGWTEHLSIKEASSQDFHVGPSSGGSIMPLGLQMLLQTYIFNFFRR
jgi:hypothetical protein